MSDALIDRRNVERLAQEFHDCDELPITLLSLCDRIEELEAKLEAIEALMVRRIQSVSHNSTSYNQDTLSDSRKRKNSVREYALSLALGEIRQVIKGQTGGIDDRIPN